jgi:predicted CoA-binding protein
LSTAPGSDTSKSVVEALLHAGSVAVVGASDDPTKISGRPLHYLLSAGYGGGI